MKTLGFLLLSLLIITPNALARVPKDVSQFEAAVKKDPGDMDKLLMYPSDVREAMLEASLFPDTIARLGQEQAKTVQQFRSLIQPYPRKIQEQVYELVRYPTLMKKLTEGDIGISFPSRIA